MTTIDRKKAFAVPQSVFEYPRAVVHCGELSHDHKVKLRKAANSSGTTGAGAAALTCGSSSCDMAEC